MRPALFGERDAVFGESPSVRVVAATFIVLGKEVDAIHELAACAEGLEGFIDGGDGGVGRVSFDKLGEVFRRKDLEFSEVS